MKAVYKRPECMFDLESGTNFCGGCGHGITTRLLMELIDEMKVREKMVLCIPIGCSGSLNRLVDVDRICCLHGRAPATATGIKRCDPNKFVFVYQGDGDLASEGMAEIMHAAIRSEKFSVCFINNAIFGMTGGQVAPTTLIGQYATTAPGGRQTVNTGYPVNMAEIMAGLPGVYYSARVTINSPARIAETKKAMKKLFEYQLAGKGLNFLEILVPCPTNWGMAPIKAMEWIDTAMVGQYPLGVFKDMEAEK